jgi:hypothetical protein
VSSLFRRKAEPSLIEDATSAESDKPATSVAGIPRKAYTPSKKELGQATPKRKVGGRVVQPPPANRREALKRMREKQRESRREAREGMMSGKEEFLPVRDKGPERALVRNIVDSRRNAASYFLPAAFIVIIGASQAMPPAVRYAANLFWVLIAVAVIVDSVLLSRKVKRLVTERFPKGQTSGHTWYAIMRSISIRRMRIPAPQVKLGQKV